MLGGVASTGAVVSVAALRERLSAMGGVAAVAAAPHRPTQVDAVGRAAALGFSAHGVGRAAIFQRTTHSNLAAECAEIGLDSVPSAADLTRLMPRRQRSVPADLDENDVVVLDIETLGLRGSGVVAFLVGLGTIEAGRLVIEQFLLADPDAEGAMLDAVSARLVGRRLLLSYNGRSFDIPVLISRCIVTRSSAASYEEPIHVDILTAVRRLFRGRLGSCRLGQAEAGLLNFHRHDDIPGAEAPARYRAWLRGASAAALDGVVEHNRVDIVSTLLVGMRVAAHIRGQLVAPPHPADHLGLAVHMERWSLADGALADPIEDHLRTCYRLGAQPWMRQAGHRLARRLWRRGDVAARAEAAALYLEIWHADANDLRAARQLCIALQRRGELPAAIAVCRDVLRRLEQLPANWVVRLAGAPSEGWLSAWQHRLGRLEARRR